MSCLLSLVLWNWALSTQHWIRNWSPPTWPPTGKWISCQNNWTHLPSLWSTKFWTSPFPLNPAEVTYFRETSHTKPSVPTRAWVPGEDKHWPSSQKVYFRVKSIYSFWTLSSAFGSELVWGAAGVVEWEEWEVFSALLSRAVVITSWSPMHILKWNCSTRHWSPNLKHSKRKPLFLKSRAEYQCQLWAMSLMLRV